MRRSKPSRKHEQHSNAPQTRDIGGIFLKNYMIYYDIYIYICMCVCAVYSTENPRPSLSSSGGHPSWRLTRLIWLNCQCHPAIQHPFISNSSCLSSCYFYTSYLTCDIPLLYARLPCECLEVGKPSFASLAWAPWFQNISKQLRSRRWWRQTEHK